MGAVRWTELMYDDAGSEEQVDKAGICIWICMMRGSGCGCCCVYVGPDRLVGKARGENFRHRVVHTHFVSWYLRNVLLHAYVRDLVLEVLDSTAECHDAYDVAVATIVHHVPLCYILSCSDEAVFKEYMSLQSIPNSPRQVYHQQRSDPLSSYKCATQ
jgi:hypothetical protein